jgi:multidrug resistance efflux pump
MNHNRPPIPVIIILVTAVAIGAWFLISQAITPVDTTLGASGTIEAIDIAIAPELAGKVSAVFVEEGQSVKTGDVLFQLDGTLLKAQREASTSALDSAKAAVQTSEAALATAQANTDLAINTARNENLPKRNIAWKADQPADFNQPVWYFTKADQIAAAQAEVDMAKAALDKAAKRADSLEQKAASADFLAAEKRLLEARAAFLTADDVLTRANDSGDGDLKDAAQSAYDDALTELDDAQKNYDDLFTTDAAKDVLQARAEHAVAQERYDTALDRFAALQTGEESLKVTAARRALEQAEAALAQSKLGVKQAEAQIALIDVQIGKLEVRSPADGVIQTRNIEPGEFIQPGSTALIIAQADSLTITVFLPEDRYGEIELGGKVTVSVDSFPGVTFSAHVIKIADKAEFTPRNVQTTEGRKTTVFAIKLQLDDPSGKLKAGMPADVVFSKKQ